MWNELSITVSSRPPDDQSEVLPVDCQLDIEFQHTGSSVLVNFKSLQFSSVNGVSGKDVPWQHICMDHHHQHKIPVNMLTGTVPVDGVQDYGAGDDGVNVDIGLPQSYHDLPQQHRGIIAGKLTCWRNQSGVEDRCTERKSRMASHTSPWTEKWGLKWKLNCISGPTIVQDIKLNLALILS